MLLTAGVRWSARAFKRGIDGFGARLEMSGPWMRPFAGDMLWAGAAAASGPYN